MVRVKPLSVVVSPSPPAVHAAVFPPCVPGTSRRKAFTAEHDILLHNADIEALGACCDRHRTTYKAWSSCICATAFLRHQYVLPSCICSYFSADSTTCKTLQKHNLGRYLKRIESILLEEGSRARQEERRTGTVPETLCYDFLLTRGIMEDLCTRALANVRPSPPPLQCFLPITT